MPHIIWSDTAWSEMFQLTVSIGEKMLRPVIVYAFLVTALRVFGKRELAQLNALDLVVLLTLSNTVQNAIIGNDNTVTGGLIGALTLLLVNFLLVRSLFKHRWLDHFVEGHPTTLIKDGKVVKSALDRELLTETELATVAHRQGFPNLAEIDRAVLEPGGSFNITGKEPSTEDERYQEIIKRLDELTRQVSELKRSQV